MKLIRYQYPQSPSASTFNRLFDLGGASMTRFGSFLDDFLTEANGYTQPAANLFESEQGYHARLELSGFKKGDVDLELENSVLTVSSRKSDQKDDSLSLASFQRSISVPDDVDFENVNASLVDGVLTVNMPKAAATKPRQISVD